MGRELLTFLGLLMVFEGVLYALFPRAYIRAVAEVSRWPVARLRLAGLVVAIAGAGILAWVVHGTGSAGVIGFDGTRRLLGAGV